MNKDKLSELEKKVQVLEQTNQSLRRAEDVNTVLFEISNAVNTTFNLDDLFTSIHTSLSKIIDVTNFYISEYDRENDLIIFPFYQDETGDSFDLIQNISRMKASLTGIVLKKGEPLFLKEADVLDIYTKVGSQGFGSVPKAWIGVPLKYRNSVIGVVVVQSYSDHEVYTRQDVDLLSSVSDQVAIAIDRKRNEESLINSERKYRNLIENINDVVFSTHENGMFSYIGPSVKKITGYTQEEITKIWYRYHTTSQSRNIFNFENIIYRDDIDPVDRQITEAIKNNTSYDISYRVIKKDGRFNWVNEKGVILKDESGSFRIEGMIYDIHDRKFAEDVNNALFEISTSINTTFNLDELYRSIHRSLERIMYVDNFFIALYHKTKDMITFPFVLSTVGDTNSFIIKNSKKSSALTSRVIHTGKPVMMNQDEQEAYYRKIRGKMIGKKSALWLGVPLIVKDKVIGAMVTQSYRDSKIYGGIEAEIFKSVSGQVAIAIDRKRSEEELILQEQNIRTLFQISNAVNTTENLAELYKSIHTSLIGILDVTNFYISIYDKKSDTLKIPYSVDEKDTYDPDFVFKHISKQYSMTGEVILKRKSLIMTKQDVSNQIDDNNTLVTGSVPEVWVGVPLKIRQEVIGSIVVQSYTDQTRFSARDVEFLESVSDQVAIAIDHKRAENALEESRKQLAYLSKQTEQFSMAAASMITDENPTDVFNKISNAIIQYSDFKRVIISFLINESPYREILAYGGINKQDIEKLKDKPVPKQVLKEMFETGEDLGQFSHYISRTKDTVIDQDMLIESKLKHSETNTSNTWHPSDMLLVSLKDMGGNLIGFVSVDDSRSQKKPTDESVRPLEIFASLVSQIIIYTKSQDELNKAQARTERANLELQSEISDRKKAEKELKVAKDLAEASAKSKSEFLANMSHEIRTPMNAIMGLTDLSLKTELDLRQKDYLKKIKLSSTSLLGIINDILDFSKIEAGKMDIEQVRFRLSDVLDSLSDMFSIKTAEKKLEMIVSISPDIPSRIIGDPLRLRQVLINLTGNAVKFTEQGEITVRVFLKEQKNNHLVIGFSVNDTGIGIPEDRLNSLFDSFVQVDGSTTRLYGGTGLGLSISKQLVELMGGNIQVESEEGKGSTFTFYLDFREDRHTRSKKHPVIRDLGCLKVLVIDDNQASREIMHETLTSFKFNPDTARTGESSLEKLLDAWHKNEPFDLVILDLRMPGIDGIETTKIIRNDIHVNKTPVIMMTAFGREDVIQQAKQAGVNAFLMKPVKQSLILDTIMDLFHKKPDFYKLDKARSPDTGIDYSRLNGLRVLLTEDNEINQQVAVEILEDVKICVDVANTGLEAIKILEHMQYDVVLMDIQMPEMDGYTATGLIRNNLKLKDMPVIAMTAHAMAGDREKCLSAGMNDYISKPIDPEVVYSKLILWMGNGGGDQTVHLPDISSYDDHNSENRLTADDQFGIEVSGIDVDSGIKRVKGNRDLYFRLLKGFRSDFSDSYARLVKQIKNRELKEARDYIHTIKGISGNISAFRLSTISASLEAGIDAEPDSIDELLANYQKELNCVMKSVQQILDDHDQKTESDISDEKNTFTLSDINDKMTSLYEKITQNDIEVIDIFDELKPMIDGRVPGKFISELEHLVTCFNFEQSEKTLLKLSEMLNVKIRIKE